MESIPGRRLSSEKPGCIFSCTCEIHATTFGQFGDDAKGKPRVPFPKLVDPFDDLNRVQSDRCVHTPDNVVQYLEGYENEAGLFRYVRSREGPPT